MLDTMEIYKFCLKFGNVYIIFAAIIIGAIFHKRDLYIKAMCCLGFAMIFNTLLKHIFKIPLFPHLGNGYAFPSGHMHAACMFYGYFIYKVKSIRIKMMFALLLFCIGGSLIKCHYHNLFDVMGAVCFAFVELMIYHILKEKNRLSDFTLSKILIGICMFIIGILYCIHKIEFHVYAAFLVMCSGLVIHAVLNKLKLK